MIDVEFEGLNMIVWLASYPRSGNTFLRMILNRCFDLKTSSVYENDLGMLKDSPDIASLTGHIDLKENESNPIKLVKTHNVENDDRQTIYIVRDGRAAVVSFLHYLRDIDKMDISLEEVIAGRSWFGTWANHVESWDPKNRKNTLLIRYEDMLQDPGNTASQLSKFLEIAQVRDFDIKFNSLHSREPLFFRKASNEVSFNEIAPHIDLFNQYNAEIMKYMGYY